MTPKELVDRIEKLFDEADIFEGHKTPETANEMRNVLRPLIIQLITEIREIEARYYNAPTKRS